MKSWSREPLFNTMATVLFLFLSCLTVSVLESSPDKDLHPRCPHLTGCVSTNMETFYCRWDVCTVQNLSKPEDVRLFYISKTPPHATLKEWSECPHYSTEKLNECFFNENHTSVWVYYSVQLRSRDQTILYDEKHFCVQDIVQPDPPVSLNWTVLNVSLTGNFYDIILNWKPPPSADVGMGWMTLQYEVQYRKVDFDNWEMAELVKSTHRSLYGLQSNINYEVRVRSRSNGGKEFGEFSDSIFVHVPAEASQVPLVALLIFGTLCLVAIVMVVVVSKQEKLMVILLPPVPGPKIRGIDSELLKKGKLKKLTSILGSPPDLRPELYTNDPWVEFIDLDIEEQNDRLTNLDTDCLMDRSLFSNCSHLSIGFRDNDSGHASCCDPDLPSDAETSHFHPLIPNPVRNKEQAAARPSSASQSTTAGDPPLAAPVREALYTQVSEVKASGKVLLSPEEEVEKDTVKENKEDQKELRLLVTTDRSGYTSEINARKMSPSLPTMNTNDMCSARGDLSSVPSSSSVDYHKPCPESVKNPTPSLPPAPAYTVVEDVGMQNSLVLTPNSIPTSKAVPTPDSYLTLDLLGSIAP
ncbi:growth hormone receptor b isoform X2 [Dunckerocampus dactyliophorus]|uniref:growth hormone receptor b isoform X2 n=1 Tax=Dunckerocampus dactyliophorus TaxID=161453 RepID=UPI0024068456|nr:growth hormone receptor b isoform X2 [Dunckerocampus dactyliophorus]XP_054613330.1 growth hormone receptor b isoform X2 [Dunckerocampus dactyliophorus]